jgi:hypothetical protein
MQSGVLAAIAALVVLGCDSKPKEVTLEMEMTAMSTSSGATSPPTGSPGQAPSAAPIGAAHKQPVIDPVLAGFMDWAASNWDNPHKATDSQECYGSGDPDAGWCLANRWVDNRIMSVQWWKLKPSAVRFDMPSFDEAVSCADIGPHELKGSHKTKHAAHEHCQLTDGPFKGHHVDIQRKQRTWHVLIFSKDYIVKDGDFMREVSGVALGPKTPRSP